MNYYFKILRVSILTLGLIIVSVWVGTSGLGQMQQKSLPEEYEGVYLQIVTSTNTLHIYLNDHILTSLPVSTGVSKQHTPKGTFQIITKVKNPWYLPRKIAGGSPSNPLGSRWMGLSVPGSNGYKYGIHGTNDPASIGQHVSQGCIRMHNQHIEWLFEHIPLQTFVEIIE